MAMVRIEKTEGKIPTVKMIVNKLTAFCDDMLVKASGKYPAPVIEKLFSTAVEMLKAVRKFKEIMSILIMTTKFEEFENIVLFTINQKK